MSNKLSEHNSEQSNLWLILFLILGIQMSRFKTDQNLKVEMERNPALLAGIKNFLFGETTPEEKSKLKSAIAEGCTNCSNFERLKLLVGFIYNCFSFAFVMAAISGKL